MDRKKTGMDKIKELMKVSKVEKIVETPTSDEGDEPKVILVEETPFLKMVVEFEKFIAENKRVSSYRLRMFKNKAGEFLVYQGSLACIWAILRDRRCYFYKTSLLRSVKSLAKGSILFEYFKGYKLTGGIE